jgi:hypothetical protein
MTVVSNNCSSKALHVQFMTCVSTKHCLIIIQQMKVSPASEKTFNSKQNAHNNTNTFTNYCIQVTLIPVACAWCLTSSVLNYKYGYLTRLDLPSSDRYVMCDCLLTKGRVTIRLIR